MTVQQLSDNKYLWHEAQSRECLLGPGVDRCEGQSPQSAEAQQGVPSVLWLSPRAWHASGRDAWLCSILPSIQAWLGLWGKEGRTVPLAFLSQSHG